MDTSEQFKQGQLAGKEVYQNSPNLNVSEQAEKAYEQLCNTVGESSARLMGEERSDFMMGFGSGYYGASQG